MVYKYEKSKIISNKSQFGKSDKESNSIEMRMYNENIRHNLS